MNALESAQGDHGLHDGAHRVVHVHLHHLVARFGAGVGDSDGHPCRLFDRDAGPIKRRLAEVKGRVAESEAEGKQRCAVSKDLTAPCSGGFVVVHGQLPHVARNRYRQMA
jgi:hypothetical protein